MSFSNLNVLLAWFCNKTEAASSSTWIKNTLSLPLQRGKACSHLLGMRWGTQQVRLLLLRHMPKGRILSKQVWTWAKRCKSHKKQQPNLSSFLPPLHPQRAAVMTAVQLPPHRISLLPKGPCLSGWRGHHWKPELRAGAKVDALLWPPDFPSAEAWGP